MIRNIQFLFFFILAVVCLDANPRKRRPCVNGEMSAGKCLCYDAWTGDFCHRKMNCDGYERLQNGSCTSCHVGWQHPDCDVIDCFGHGEPNSDSTACHCEEPYSGEYCEIFEKKDVYKWYNNWTCKIGALGAIVIIPAVILYLGCEWYSDRRKAKKVMHVLGGKVNLNSYQEVDNSNDQELQPLY